MLTTTVASMTKPELIASLLKHGGRVLLVGGSVSDLPRAYQEHPQIIVWDDNQQGFLQKEIPSNVKVIMWNRWISHTMVTRLHSAASQLHAIKFPMLKTREIKELLAEVVQTDPPDVPVEEVNAVVEREIEREYRPSAEGNGIMKKKQGGERGFLQEFIAKHMDVNVDYGVKGSIAKEGKRLFEIAQKEGVKTTEASLTNAIGTVARNIGKKPARAVKHNVPSASGQQDDFEQLGVLIEDAIAAMKLVQEHLPKVRRETERLRGMREKVLKLFS